jgi:hypothetical protein
MSMVSPQGPSSFIPKAPASKNAPRPRGIKKIYIFTYISLVLFFGTLIASAGTFFFDVTVKGQLAQQKEQLANERNAFNASDLVRLRDLERRIESAKRIIESHVSVSKLFTALEASTVSGVQLTGASYERSAFGGINFAVGARTESLNTARFQRDIFAANEILRSSGLVNPQFTTRREQIGATQTGPQTQSVVFSLAGTFTVDDVAYSPESVSVPMAESILITDEAGTSTTGGGVFPDLEDENSLEFIEVVNE